MPSNDLADVGVEPLARRSYVGSDRGCRRDHRGILTASWGRLKAVAREFAEGTEFTNGETEKTEAKRRDLAKPSAGLRAACWPKAGDWVERGAVGASSPEILAACARRSPLHPGRATARREPSQPPSTLESANLTVLIRRSRSDRAPQSREKLPTVCAAQHLHTPQACLPHPGGVNHLTNQIIGAAIRVHRELGPGLLESTYAAPEKRRKPVLERHLRARAPAEGRRLGGEGSGGRKQPEILRCLCPPLPSPPRPRTARREPSQYAESANLPVLIRRSRSDPCAPKS